MYGLQLNEEAHTFIVKFPTLRFISPQLPVLLLSNFKDSLLCIALLISSAKFVVDWLQNNELTLTINNEDEWGKVI